MKLVSAQGYATLKTVKIYSVVRDIIQWKRACLACPVEHGGHSAETEVKSMELYNKCRDKSISIKCFTVYIEETSKLAC